MILYLDSSALLKLYVTEHGSDLVAEAVERATACCSHLIAYAEVRAGLARALRMGRETPEGLTLHKAEFAEAWQQVDVILPDLAMIRRAGDLAEELSLRGYDAVHLAAVEWVWERVRPAAAFRFAVFDADLARASESLGIPLLKETG